MADSYLGIQVDELERKFALNTAKEIENQPDIWMETFLYLKMQSKEISKFLDKVYLHKDLNVVLTGAGSSSFIGKVLEAPFQFHTGIYTKAISTTILVTHPNLYFQKKTPTLLISFARSGNSPESIKAVELANSVCKKVFHLIITCNETGKLAQSISDEDSFVFVLPAESNDKGLAMTSSFTSMLLSGLLVARINKLNDLRGQVELIANYAKRIFEKYLQDFKNISELNFKRAIFLGSGPFVGIAQESHLKLQELTDGRIICKHDSFLGFRHGPKAVIDNETLIVYLFSNDSYVLKYEKDLVNSVNSGRGSIYRIGVMSENIDGLEIDTKIIFSQSTALLEEEFLSIVSVLPAQIIAFYKSINLGLKPDFPSESGMINRVVQGVNLYPHNHDSSSANFTI